MLHGVGQPDGLLLVGLYLAADVGMEPDEVGDDGMIGMGFENMGHVRPLRIHSRPKLTDRPALARKVVKRIEAEIERGEYKRKAAPDRQQPTFIDAAINYMETGHTSRYVQELVDYFRDTPLSEIDQAAIDQAAVAIKPNGTPMNRCAAVYTPVSAILHFAGVDITIRRSRGWQGKQRSDWLTPDDAFGIITAADSFDPEFATLLTWPALYRLADWGRARPTTGGYST